MTTPTITPSNTELISLIKHKEIQSLKNEYKTADQTRKQDIEMDLLSAASHILGYFYETIGGIEVVENIILQKDYAAARIHINKHNDKPNMRVFLATTPNWDLMYK